MMPPISCFYIVCPQKFSSGGPESLHQLSYYLSDQGVPNKIAYQGPISADPTPERYKKYVTDYVFLSQLKDSPNLCIITPETNTDILYKFTQAHKAVWWLSVDFYLHSQKELRLSGRLRKVIKFLSKNNLREAFRYVTAKKHCLSYSTLNFVTSHYAKNFLEKNNVTNIELLVRPLSTRYYETPPIIDTTKSRADTILYNPKKDLGVVDKLRSFNPSLKFKKLERLTSSQIDDAFQSCMLYVDFGSFPGPERLPAEAAINGCCIITSKIGAAAFDQDINIPDEYKIENLDDIKSINDKILNILNNYESEIDRFSNYRDKILGLESDFKYSINRIFTTSSDELNHQN